MHVGTHLEQLRLRAGISGAAIGRALGYARNTVCAWEKGRVEISAENLARYLDHVGATPEERLHALDLAKGGSAVRAVA